MIARNVVICSLTWISFSTGFIFGQVGGMIRSLQKNDEGLDLSDGQISLIASIMMFTSTAGFGLSAIATDKVGRRWPFIIFSISAIVSMTTLYFARKFYEFIISRILTGISVGALFTLNIFVTAEYTPSTVRPCIVNMVTTVAPAFGTSLGHAIGIILHWRTVSLIAVTLHILGIILPFLWIESPHWLASKGKFNECRIAFRKLHGEKIDSGKELELLIRMEETKLRKAEETNCKATLKRLLLAFQRKYFWDVIILCIFLHAYFTAAGKLVFSVLATVILEEITGTEDVLYYTLLVDVFIITGACLSCYLIRKTTIRTLLFSTGFSANAILLVFSACFYFKNSQVYFNWINITLLAIYFIIINAGPYPVLELLYSEMFPLELKVYIFFITGIFLNSALMLTIILLPYTVDSIGYHGLFLLNAAIMSVSLGYVWLRLPETKGKTLQEIEIFFKTRNFDVTETFNEDQAKALI